MFRRKVTAALALAAVLALSACSGSPTTSDSSGATGGTLTLVATVAPKTLDASGAEWANQTPYFQAAYDTLLLADADGTIKPFLASAWQYNDANTALTLTLRNDVKFSDGSALTSEVVKTNLERFKAGTSSTASALRNVASIDTPDAQTVVINLTDPDPALVTYLTREAGLIASGQAIAADAAALATDPIGSGPYIMDTASTVIGTSYVYTKNPNYWDPAIQHYDKVVVNTVADQTAALNIIKSGEANGVRLASNLNLAEVQASGWTVNAGEINVGGLLLFDRAGTMVPALGDVRVRQAINYALDRPGLLQALQKGAGTVTEQVFPSRSTAFDSALDSTYSYDPAKAKQLLSTAGYASGFTLNLPTSPSIPPAAYTLLQQLFSDVGITVNYTDAGNNYIADLVAAKYPAGYINLEQGGDWQVAQFMISPTATWNPFHYQDATVDGYLKSMQFGTQTERDQAATELNKYIVDQAWFAPFFRPQNSIATDAHTTVKMLPTNVYPNLYDFQQK
ncbi:ABC transporter substrate-binding protein [Subtercola frigoramans]|uniref:Peptide/nickel transport system substrate-binding protein n=1 Tax=Subtercola frigoramans TaxID=120298 RepID=A0ABS2L890_9MICO|nr:ABC transporter substrate-binding protein [Subtercola frigoramans]MBM7473106.1 peptide/nickel transport system substrate-binding protein [Subtercola frigoramans]